MANSWPSNCTPVGEPAGDPAGDLSGSPPNPAIFLHKDLLGCQDVATMELGLHKATGTDCRNGAGARPPGRVQPGLKEFLGASSETRRSRLLRLRYHAETL